MRTKSEIMQGENEELFNLKCSLDFCYFYERVLGMDIKRFHRRWAELLKLHKRIVISAAVGHGKSAYFGVGVPLWLSIFKPGSQSLIISKVVKGQSSNILSEIKYSIEDNEYLSEYLKPADNDKSNAWKQDMLHCSNNSKIFLKAYSSSVKGSHVDYIFGDEISSYPDKVNHYLIWFRDVSSRVSNKGGQIVAASTPEDPGDLLDVLMNNPVYHGEEFPAIINYTGNDYFTGEPIWAERFPISKLKDAYLEQGQARFERNYMVNRSADVVGAIFKVKDLYNCFDYNRKFTTEIMDENGLIFIGGDFAMADGPQADFDAYVVIEKTTSGYIYVKEIVVPPKGTPTDEKIRMLVALAKKHNPFQFILDESNVGRDITRALINQGYAVEPIKFGPRARGNMLGTLKSAIENKLLILPYSKEELNEQQLVNDLVDQLIGFKEEKSEKTRTTTIASHSPHDDIAMCYDENTEVLTNNGWKKFSEIELDDKIYSLNPITHYTEETKIENKIERDYNGKMIHFKARSIDLVVTPNHNMYASVSKGANQYDSYKLICADSLIGKHFKLKRDANWEGRDMGDIILPMMSNNCNWIAKERKILLDDFLELLGFYISEGWGDKNKLIISQLLKSKGWNPIKTLLDRMKLNYREIKDGFVIYDKQLATYIKFLVPGLCYEKRIPHILLRLRKDKLERIFRALMLGDGYKDKCYVTTNKGLADDVSELALKLGYCPTILTDLKAIGKKAPNGIGRFPCLYVYLSKINKNVRFNHHKRYGATVSERYYKGKIYCLKLNKNHIMYVRRNGKCLWSGNSLALAVSGAAEQYLGEGGI